ncbi:MAG: carbohydrate kinase family protein [Anaerolineae bacterium]
MILERATRSAQGSEPESRASPQVVGVGYAALDYLGVVAGMPQFDDAESVKPVEWLISGGGPVATALVALARLGVPVAYIGLLGDEMVGHEIRREFVREGVDVTHLRHQKGLRSPTSFVLVEVGTGRRAFISFRDRHQGFDLTPADRRVIERARILHLDGWYPEAALPAARIAKGAGVLVSLDAYIVSEETDEWVSLSDVLIANESFTWRYTGHRDLEKAAGTLLDQGPRWVVTTLGERGCFVATCKECFHMPGFAVKVVDTTGAGDAFHGAFLYGLLQGWSLAHIARFANAVGALTCRRLGGRTSIPTLDEAEGFLEGTPQPSVQGGYPSSKMRTS